MAARSLLDSPTFGVPVAIGLLWVVLAVHGGAGEPSRAPWASFQNGGDSAVPVPLPIAWTPDGDNLAWQAEIEGYGQSTPIVRDSRVVVTSTSGPQKERFHVTAFHLGTGDKLWQRDFDNPTHQENNTYVSRAAPSPVADRDGFIALNEGGVLVALTADGEPRWQRNLVADYGPIETEFGLAASLEQDDASVFVWIERSEKPYVAAIAKATGETLWRVDGLGTTSWSSPRLIPVPRGAIPGGPTLGDASSHEMHLVCSGIGKIVGLDPATGARLWELDEISNNSTCTPIPLGDGRFLIGAGDGRGEASKAKAMPSSGVVRIERGDTGDFSAAFVWRAEKATCSFGSPTVAAGRVWIVNRSGVLYQLDLETGEELATQRVKSGSTWATPLVADGKLYLFGQKGTTSVIGLDDSDELAVNTLWDASTASAAASDRATAASSRVLYAAAAAPPYLLLRTGQRLYAIADRTTETSRPTD